MTFVKRSKWQLRAAVAVMIALSGSAMTTAYATEGCTDGCFSSSCDALECEDNLGCDSLACGSACDGSRFGGIASKLTLGGLIKPSDHCFDDFISPMINFVYFEDPRTLTELRPIFVTHSVPDVIGGGVPAGGSIQLYAMQFRVALTERLSLIAVKDGYIVDNTEGALDTLLDDGWADVSAGLKYNLIRDTQTGTLASAGAVYEIPMGSRSALQDIGDGEFHFFLTGGQRLFGGNAHVLSAVGYRTPVDGSVQNASIHWSNHFDVKLTDRLYAFTEVAWWHITDEAEAGLGLGVSGQDLFNLPANNVAGNSLVTQNVGLRFKPKSNIETGIAYEFPLTEFKDVIEDRLMVDLIFRY
jgi:hypothetical protein